MTGNCPWCDGVLDLERGRDECTCEDYCGEEWCKAPQPSDYDDFEDC